MMKFVQVFCRFRRYGHGWPSVCDLENGFSLFRNLMKQEAESGMVELRKNVHSF